MNVSPSLALRRASPAISPSTAASSSSVGTRRNSDLPICGLGPEAAAHEDVVGLAPHAALVARGRALEAEVADPVLRAGVRAAVEVQPQRRRSASPKRSSRWSISRPRRVFVSATEKLQCGSPVQAIELPRTGLMSSGKPIRSSSATASSTVVVRDAGDDEVLLAREPDVAAVALGQIRDRDHLVAARSRPRWTGTPMYESPSCFCAWTPRWCDGSTVDRRQRVVLELAAELRLDALADAFGPMSSTMNLSRALTRETR